MLFFRAAADNAALLNIPPAARTHHRAQVGVAQSRSGAQLCGALTTRLSRYMRAPLMGVDYVLSPTTEYVLLDGGVGACVVYWA